MKQYIYRHQIIHFSLIILISISFLSCKKEALDGESTSVESNLDTDDTAISLEGDLQISDFVWQGLNQWYYWQEEVEALADSKLTDTKAYAQFINDNPDPDAFFESLKHPDDRFSWIEDDYVKLENSLQGIYATNGVEFGLTYACQDCEEVVGYVKYILVGSDADGKNIQRGDFFTGVNNTTLTVNNYRSLLFGEDLTYTLNMAEVQDGTLQENGIVVELTKVENFETNPIQISKTINTAAGKVGYLMYNQFVANKSNDLNQVFAEFKSEGIIDLILDLRYNGGGSVRNCIELSSMITGQFTDEVFVIQEWNNKLNEYLEERYGRETLIDRFTDVLSDNETINSLGLNKIYILTTGDSASASELLINGLSPYIDVIHIGEQTVGKNVGSITLYDYLDNSAEQTRNPDHQYAMQPIVLKYANKDGFADYNNGLTPSEEIEEDIRNYGTLGEIDEPYLAMALSLISGTGKSTPAKPVWNKSLLFSDPFTSKKQRMFLDQDLPFLPKANEK